MIPALDGSNRAMETAHLDLCMAPTVLVYPHLKADTDLDLELKYIRLPSRTPPVFSKKH